MGRRVGDTVVKSNQVRYQKMRNLTTVPMLMVVLAFLSGCGATRITSCFTANKTYPTTGLTHVDTHMETAEECQDSCKDECAGFTWINHESSLLPKICALFNETDTEIDCKNCVSGPKECPCYFSGECEMTDANFVDVQHSVDDIAGCHSLCKIFDNENCNHFTYYNDKSDFPHLCFLFNDCATNNTNCADGCVHGPRECNFCSWEETKAGTCSEYGGGEVAGAGGAGGATTPTTLTASEPGRG